MKPIQAVLLLLSALLPVSIAGINAAAGLLSLLILYAGDRRSLKRSLGPVVLVLLGYAAVTLIAALAGEDPQGSMVFVRKELHKAWIAFVLTAALSRVGGSRTFEAFAAGTALVSVIGIVQALGGDPGRWDGALPRASGFIHPVSYGEILAFALLGGLCRLGEEQRLRERSLWAGWTALAAAALLLSQTRAAVISAAAGALAIGAVSPRLRRHLPKVALAGALLVAAWEVVPIGSRSFSGMARAALSGQADYDQFHRLTLWRTAWRMFLSRPVLGLGPGQYRANYARYGGPKLDGQDVWGSAHNLYLHQLAERGALGLAALLSVFGVLGWLTFDAARRNGGFGALWAWGSMTAFVAMNMTENAFQNEQVSTAFLFICLMGIASASKREI